MAIPGKELVGKNANLVDGVYSDNYLIALNQYASVDYVFGEHTEAIAQGEYDAVARLVMGTLGEVEYESHLVALVMTAAEAGEWKAVEIEPRPLPGLDVVTKKHFGHVTQYQGKTFLMPSAMYLAYCKEQI